ncbi:MAG: alpha/beta hydrolase [Oscillospiraceae bacterium]
MLFLEITLIIAGGVFAVSLIIAFALLLDATGKPRGGKLTVDHRRKRYGETMDDCEKQCLAKPWQDVYITARDGVPLHALWLPAAGADKSVILVHGYRSSGACDFCGITEYYAARGFNILMPDQRAHGESGGKRVGFGSLERYDAAAWARLVAEKAQGDIYLHGISLGAVSVTMASCLELPQSVRGVVADCGFTSPMEVLTYQLKKKYHLPKFPVMPAVALVGTLLLGRGFVTASSVEAVKKTTLPFLIIQGEDDLAVPPYMAQSIYSACASEKTLLLVPNARHAASALEAPEKYAAALDEFYARVGGKQ